MTNVNELYNKDFYAINIANRAQYDRLGDVIYAVSPRRSFVEIGCGAGLTLARLKDYGRQVRGFDGSTAALESAPESVRPFMSILDLTKEAPDPDLAETAICVEVAEHLPAEAADHLVAVVASVATEDIIWSAAPPGQGGVDHINEQPPAYWLDKFAMRGWRPDAVSTAALRLLMTTWRAQHFGASPSFHVLRQLA